MEEKGGGACMEGTFQTKNAIPEITNRRMKAFLSASPCILLLPFMKHPILPPPPFSASHSAQREFPNDENIVAYYSSD